MAELYLYLEGPEVDEEANRADYVDYNYDYDSEPLLEGPEGEYLKGEYSKGEVDYDLELFWEGYGDREEDRD
ncbi:hypothetical protein V8E51_005296 [Hyaloscypha variabilis]